MNISWYGHRCVRIEAKGASILVDPFDPKEAGLRGPAIKDDLVLLSEHTPPLSVTERINDDALVIRNPGEYEKKGVNVRGVQAAQDSQQGKELGLASVFVLHAEDMTVCHLGALGQGTLTDEQLEAVGDCDILLIPAGGQGALDAKAAAALAMQIEPKVIVPIGAEKPDKFIKEMGLPVQKMDSLRIQKKTLPVDQTMLAVLAS